MALRGLVSWSGLLLLLGCATPRPVAPVPLEQACAEGGATACQTLGDRLLAGGNVPGAEGAYEDACAGNLVQGCVAAGKLYLAHGDLPHAEPPLQKAVQAEDEEAYEALAALLDARGTREGHVRAERLRFDALALKQSDAEFTFLYRLGTREGSALDVRFGLQPMAFFSRRLNVGGELVVDDTGHLAEANGRLAYQHFLTRNVVGFVGLLAGSRPTAPAGQRFNPGAEAGLKVGVEGLGNLSFGVGSTRQSPAHLDVGVGLDWELALVLAALAAG